MLNPCFGEKVDVTKTYQVTNFHKNVHFMILDDTKTLINPHHHSLWANTLWSYKLLW